MIIPQAKGKTVREIQVHQSIAFILFDDDTSVSIEWDGGGLRKPKSQYLDKVRHVAMIADMDQPDVTCPKAGCHGVMRFERSSGHSGYRCATCGQWHYQIELERLGNGI